MIFMDAKLFLTGYAQKVERYLDGFFAVKGKEADRISSVCREMVDIYRDHLRGGKKARGALMVLGYRLAGGRNEEKIFKASIYPEIVQSFLLIHDDIMDQDLVRRGKPTPQAFYTSSYKEKGFAGDAKHFGLSMALDLGDFGMYLGQEALFKSGFEKEKIAKVISLSNKVYQEVALGQALDIFGEVSGEFSEDYVLKIHFLKTAQYSITAPLQFGAILAGAKQEYLNLLGSYGDSIGIAFQLYDDILGLYGDEKSMGKEVGARDIREGKVTLLVVKAAEKAGKSDKFFLKKAYGNKKISKPEVLKVQKIIKRTGSLDYSLKKSHELAEKGKGFVPQITKNPEFQNTLCSLADFMINRTT